MTEKKIIDLPDAVRLVLEVIEDKGADFTHQQDPARVDSDQEGTTRCVNVFTQWDPEHGRYVPTAPGCLVGSALHGAGVRLADFVQLQIANTGVSETLGTLSHYRKIVTTDFAKEYLSAVQQSQDSGSNWGDAHSQGLQMILRNVELDWVGDPTDAEIAWIDARTPDMES